jgi:hypothetical protein
METPEGTAGAVAGPENTGNRKPIHPEHQSRQDERKLGLDTRRASHGDAGKLKLHIVFELEGLLRRLRAGLDARQALHGAAGKVELHICFEWQGLLRRIRAGRDFFFFF